MSLKTYFFGSDSQKKSKRKRLDEDSQHTKDMYTHSEHEREDNSSQPLFSTQTLNVGSEESTHVLTSNADHLTVPVNPDSGQMGNKWAQNNQCPKCSRPALVMKGKVLKPFIECYSCSSLYHLFCADLTSRQYDLIKETKTVHWICNQCVSLPKFRHSFIGIV